MFNKAEDTTLGQQLYQVVCVHFLGVSQPLRLYEVHPFVTNYCYLNSCYWGTRERAECGAVTTIAVANSQFSNGGTILAPSGFRVDEFPARLNVR